MHPYLTVNFIEQMPFNQYLTHFKTIIYFAMNQIIFIYINFELNKSNALRLVTLH